MENPKALFSILPCLAVLATTVPVLLLSVQQDGWNKISMVLLGVTIGTVAMLVTSLMSLLLK